MSFSWDLSDVSLMIRLRLWVWGRKITEVRCPFHHILSTWLTIVDVDLDPLAEVAFVRFLPPPHPPTSTPGQPFPYCSLRKGVTMCSPHVRAQAVNPSWANQIPFSRNLELGFRGASQPSVVVWSRCNERWVVLFMKKQIKLVWREKIM